MAGSSNIVGGSQAQVTGLNPALFGNDMPVGASGLSPDALIAFVEMNLSNTDSQVQNLMSHMNSNKDAIAAFQQLSSLIRGMKGHTHDAQGANLEKMKDLAHQCGLEVTTDNTGKVSVNVPDTCTFPHAQELENAMQGEFDAYYTHRHAAGTINAGTSRPDDALESEAQSVDAIATKLSSGGEITMIKLQSLVQERTRIIQFASNVVGALNEGVKTEVNNIRA